MYNTILTVLISGFAINDSNTVTLHSKKELFVFYQKSA